MTSRHSESLVFASQSLAVDWSGVVWPAAGGIAACAVVCVYVGCLRAFVAQSCSQLVQTCPPGLKVRVSLHRIVSLSLPRLAMF